MSKCATPALRNASSTALRHAGKRAGRTRLAHAFGAERIVRARHPRVDRFDAGHQVGARHAIIHEARGDELTVGGIVMAGFAEHLTGALHDTANELTVGKLRIDHRADVIDRSVTQDFHRPGVGIDLHFRHMRAAREGARDVALGDGVKRMRLVLRVAVDDLAHGDAAVGAGNREDAVGEHQIAGARLQRRRRQSLRLVDNHIGGNLVGAALRHGRTRADRRRANELGPFRIARLEKDAFGVQAQPLRDHVGKDGLMPLPAGPGDVVQHEIAIRLEQHRHRVLGHATAARGFHEHATADATQLLSLLRLPAADLEAVPVGGFTRLGGERRENRRCRIRCRYASCTASALS